MHVSALSSQLLNPCTAQEDRVAWRHLRSFCWPPQSACCRQKKICLCSDFLPLDQVDSHSSQPKQTHCPSSDSKQYSRSTLSIVCLLPVKKMELKSRDSFRDITVWFFIFHNQGLEQLSLRSCTLDLKADIQVGISIYMLHQGFISSKYYILMVQKCKSYLLCDIIVNMETLIYFLSYNACKANRP